MLRQHRPPGLLTEIAFAGVPGDCKRQTGTGSGRSALDDRVEERSACAWFGARRVVDDASSRTGWLSCRRLQQGGRGGWTLRETPKRHAPVLQHRLASSRLSTSMPRPYLSASCPNFFAIPSADSRVVVAEAIQAYIPDRPEMVNQEPFGERNPDGLHRQIAAPKIGSVQVDRLRIRLCVLVKPTLEHGDAPSTVSPFPRPGGNRLPSVNRAPIGNRIGLYTGRVPV